MPPAIKQKHVKDRLYFVVSKPPLAVPKIPVTEL